MWSTGLQFSQLREWNILQQRCLQQQSVVEQQAMRDSSLPALGKDTFDCV